MENIQSIVAEMREHASGSAESAWYTPKDWETLCDRIENADKCNHDMSVESMHALMKTYHDDLMRAREENERLRVALKPVLECRHKAMYIAPEDDYLYKPREMISFEQQCINAVRAAQEIMKGETK